MPWPAAAGAALLVAVGAAGLIRGAVPQAAAGGGTGASGEPIVVSDAYVRPPAPPTQAAAGYFTVYNTTDRPDILESVITGAGELAVLHTAGMKLQAGGVVVPAHGKLVFATGKGHVMIEKLFGPLKPGQSVNMDLTFAHAGVVTVSATVIALGGPVPTGGSS